MTTALQPNDRDFLAELMRSGPCGIAELCSAMDVTATAVRQKLQRLQALGLIERSAVHRDRGRPHHVYQVSESARRELGQNYRELAMLLWDEMRQIDDEPVRERLLGRIREAMVEQFREQVTAASPRERIQELASALVQRGFHVEAQAGPRNAGDLPVLREYSCPYHEIASHDASICELEQSVFAEVVGSELELTHCCQRGDRVCEFEVSGHSAPVGASVVAGVRFAGS